mmetsp:Transcript_1079/g.1207  ORF Transcript_1079/g.1207 Transcript_1079/m.1207 type:complete len:440 (+) Transcript_1079:1738-3057(+)
MFTSLSFSLVNVLPLIKNKSEATVLIAVIILSQKLVSASRVLNLSLENELLFLELQKFKCSLFEVAVRPVLSNSILLLKERIEFQVTAFSNLLEDLCRINSSLQQYGEQNMALGKELALAKCAELSQQKQNVAHLELELCRRISILKDLSRGNVIQRALVQPFQFEPLSIDHSSSSAQGEVLKSSKSDDVIINNNIIENGRLRGDISIDESAFNQIERKRKLPTSDHDDDDGNIFKKRINELSTTPGFSPSNCFTHCQLLPNVNCDKNVTHDTISKKVDVAVDTSEMSPPVELVRTDTSTPTSSQTVFSGEGIKDHNTHSKCERIHVHDMKNNNILRESLSSNKTASDSKVVQTSSTSTQYSQNQANLFRTSVNSPSISYIQQGRLFDPSENPLAMVNSPSLSEAGSDGSQLLSEQQQEQTLDHPAISRFSTIMRRQTQ